MTNIESNIRIIACRLDHDRKEGFVKCEFQNIAAAARRESAEESPVELRKGTDTDSSYWQDVYAWLTRAGSWSPNGEEILERWKEAKSKAGKRSRGKKTSTLISAESAVEISSITSLKEGTLRYEAKSLVNASVSL